MYHYGWVKPPSFQQEKQKYFHSLWHPDEWLIKNVPAISEFDYSNIDSLDHFAGSHPKIMDERIRNASWKFTFDPTKKKLSLKSRFKMFMEKHTGWRPGEYKNYKLLD